MQKKNLKFKISFKFLIVVLSFAFCLLSLASGASAEGATLFLAPSIGTYTVGDTFSIAVKVNTGEAAINAADGTLVFDPTKLEVKRISKVGSIFALWVEGPVFSNTDGTISFAGGLPSPGFTGRAGMIINITFKAKSAGTGAVSFASGSVLADDGKGTNILTRMIPGSYTLIVREIEVPPIEVPPSPPPAEKEYLPPKKLPPPDTIPPEPFEVIVDNEGDPTNPQPLFYFETKDLDSGLDYYQIKINEEVVATTTVLGTKEKPYRPPFPLPPGKYRVEIKAFDKAGNFTLASTEFEILPIEPPLLKIGKIAIDYLTTVITLIVLIVGVLAIIFYTWYRISFWRKRMRVETKEVEESVEKAFRALKEEVEEQIEFLNGKPGLTQDERRVRDKLKEALNISEEFISKEIKDIKKELG